MDADIFADLESYLRTFARRANPPTDHYFCPCCGQEFSDPVPVSDVGSGTTHLQVTCHTHGCKIEGATTTVKSLTGDRFLAAWGAPRRFDLLSGRPL